MTDTVLVKLKLACIETVAKQKSPGSDTVDPDDGQAFCEPLFHTSELTELAHQHPNRCWWLNNKQPSCYEARFQPVISCDMKYVHQSVSRHGLFSDTDLTLQTQHCMCSGCGFNAFAVVQYTHEWVLARALTHTLQVQEDLVAKGCTYSTGA